MSDVKRFYAADDFSGEEVVYASDFDALAQRCRELEEHRDSQQRVCIAAMQESDTLRAEVERFKNGLGIAQRHRDELQAEVERLRALVDQVQQIVTHPHESKEALAHRVRQILEASR